MPSGVDNLFSTTLLLPPSQAKSAPPKNDGDSFDKVLQDARPKPDVKNSEPAKDESPAQPQATTVKAKPAPAKKDDADANVKEKSDEVDDSTTPAEEETTTDAKPAQPQVKLPAVAANSNAPKPVKVEDKHQPEQPTVDVTKQVAPQNVEVKVVRTVTSAPEQAAANDAKPAVDAKPVVRDPQKPVEPAAAKANESKPKAVPQAVQQVSDQPQDDTDPQRDDSQNQNEQHAAQVVAAVNKQTTTAKPQAKDHPIDANENVQAEELRPTIKAKTVKPVDPDLNESLQNFAAAQDDISTTADDATPHAKVATVDATSDLIELAASAKPQAAGHVQTAPTTAAPAPQPEAEFAANNHDKIVSSVRTQLLPNGGTMQIRLDPPDLGQMQVTVRMNDGVLSASFETSNDQATKLLSHSLGQLKQTLETQGVSVEKLHVQQSPKDQQSESKNDERQQQASADGRSSQRDQQRREMLKRMWARLGVGDPLDMVA